MRTDFGFGQKYMTQNRHNWGGSEAITCDSEFKLAQPEYQPAENMSQRG
jgi:hypothetical protein